jgi:hypothetical protein
MPQPRRDSGLDDAQDALPASSSSRSPGKSRAARPTTGRPLGARREARFASAAPKFSPSSLRNHHDEPACSCAPNVAPERCTPWAVQLRRRLGGIDIGRRALVGCIRSGIGVCYFPGRNARRPPTPGAGQRPDWRPDPRERAPPVALSYLSSPVRSGGRAGPRPGVTWRSERTRATQRSRTIEMNGRDGDRNRSPLRSDASSVISATGRSLERL